MKMFISGMEITAEELKGMLNDLDLDEILELEEVDKYGNLHFAMNRYGLYY